MAAARESQAETDAKNARMSPTSRLRRKVNALQTYTTPVPPDSPGPRVSAETPTIIAAACRDHQRLRFDYSSHDGSQSQLPGDTGPG